MKAGLFFLILNFRNKRQMGPGQCELPPGSDTPTVGTDTTCIMYTCIVYVYEFYTRSHSMVSVTLKETEMLKGKERERCVSKIRNTFLNSSHFICAI